MNLNKHSLIPGGQVVLEKPSTQQIGGWGVSGFSCLTCQTGPPVQLLERLLHGTFPNWTKGWQTSLRPVQTEKPHVPAPLHLLMGSTPN